ncbi:MAG: HyaD/HybD family hydrogenase maturation endopeptidase [Acidobacteriota bacterium]
MALLGLGNVLMGDDALGPYAIQTLLSRNEFPPGVSVIDAGTPGLDLTPYILGVSALIVVDTVKADAPPGTVRAYRKGQLLEHPPTPRLSPHDPGLKETLLLLEFRGDGPREVLLVGVVPERVETGVGLTEVVRGALPEVERQVVEELRRLGLPPRARDVPAAPDLWWEKSPAS